MPLSHDASIRAARVTRTVERSLRNLPGHRGRWGGRGGWDRCTCVLKGALSLGSGTATVDDVLIIRGTSPLSDSTDATEELTVDIPQSNWEGDDDAVCRIEYNTRTKEWEFYDIPCPA